MLPAGGRAGAGGMLRRLAAGLAAALAWLVSCLEALIRLLGFEPERRWEDALLDEGAEKGRKGAAGGRQLPPLPVLLRRARHLAYTGDGSKALRMYSR